MFSNFGKRHFSRNIILCFIFSGGDIYTVKVQVDDEDVFYIGKERTSKFYERWSTVDINGVKGRACVEWQYNNVLNVTNKL